METIDKKKMCTLTFIPSSNSDFILTSNRDEAPGRQTFPPEIYNVEGISLMYPKDAVAGGTWIGVSGKKRAISLMNGGFYPHKRQAFYRKSRGLVVKDFLMADSMEAILSHYEFEDIEPFTAVIVEWEGSLGLSTLVWDSEKLHLIPEPIAPKIWSSSPLYPGEISDKRRQWFSIFMEANPDISKAEILDFHKTAGDGNLETNLIMDRGFVKTKSITQIVKEGNAIDMDYEDLQTETTHKIRFV